MQRYETIFFLLQTLNFIFLRCDNKAHCLDKLDESNIGDACIMLQFPQGHSKDEIPRRFSEDELLQVNVSLTVVGFLELNEIGQTLKATFNLRTRWFDGQLTFRHLQKDEELNFLWAKTYENLWFPNIILENIDPSKDFAERRLRYTILRDLESVPEVIHPGTSNATNLFKGSDHKIQRSEEYTYFWRCIYILKWFPFDRQICKMEITFPKFYRESVRLNPEKVDYHGDSDEMTEYSVEKIRFCSEANDTQLALVVTLERPLLGSILTTFLPTLLLLVIRYGNFYRAIFLQVVPTSLIAQVFAEEFIDAVVQVQVTVLLVLATL